MTHLNAKHKVAIEKAAYGECANLLGHDYGDPFKHRHLPPVPDGLEQAADDYFFECVARITKELQEKAK